MTTLTDSPPPALPLPGVIAAAAAWLALVLALGGSGALQRFRPLIPAFILGPTVLTLVLYRRGGRVRATLDRVSTRAMVATHLLRAPVGVLFLFMLEDARLPELFATRAGYGDIVAGIGALVALPFARAPFGGAARTILAWNVVALADILLVVGTAQYLVFVVDDPRMLSLADFPYIGIPFVLVPLVLVTHAVIFHRLHQDRTST